MQSLSRRTFRISVTTADGDMEITSCDVEHNGELEEQFKAYIMGLAMSASFRKGAVSVIATDGDIVLFRVSSSTQFRKEGMH